MSMDACLSETSMSRLLSGREKVSIPLSPERLTEFFVVIYLSRNKKNCGAKGN